MTEQSDYKILTPVDLTSFSEIRITKADNQELECSVEITLKNRLDNRSVTIAFEGVRNLTIKSLGAGSLIGPLKSLDLRRDQWECPLKIMDFEEESISFYCRKVTV